MIDNEATWINISTNQPKTQSPFDFKPNISFLGKNSIGEILKLIILSCAVVSIAVGDEI